MLTDSKAKIRFSELICLQIEYENQTAPGKNRDDQRQENEVNNVFKSEGDIVLLCREQ